jgi:hypothetical protein
MIFLAVLSGEGVAISWTNSSLSQTWAARKDHLVLSVNSTTLIALGGTNGSNCFNDVTLWDKLGTPGSDGDGIFFVINCIE